MYVVFDIDGTLTDTTGIDGQAYYSALSEVFDVPFEEARFSWRPLDDITDATIIRALWRVRNGEKPFDSEVEAIAESRVRGHLEAMDAAHPELIRPIAGAEDVFERVRAMGFRVAMATGAWRASAEFKLASAGLPVTDVPLATASEHVGRQDIIREAVSRAGGDLARDRVVYVGDGLWDARATAALGIPLVGRGTGERGASLHEAGATTVLPDFTDERSFREALAALA